MTYLFHYFAAGCALPKPNFLGFPTWYHYLQGTVDGNGNCIPDLSKLNNIWLILAAVIEILLRIAALVAVAMVIYGGIRYTASQGNPDDTNKARGTIISALIGLIIAVMAAAIVNFIAGSIK
jgi:hypothetical protein